MLFVNNVPPPPRTSKAAHPWARALCTGLAALTVAWLGLAASPARADPYKELFEAIQADDAAKVRLLVLRGVGTNSPDPKLGPAVVVAARNKAFKALNVLLESPLTDPNVFDKAGESALMLVALFGEMKVVRQLVARGAQVNHPGWAPLHYAATGGHRDVVTFLLEHNAYVDALSPNGTTPLMMAAREGHVAVARMLVEAGADPSLKNEANIGAPEYLMRSGNPDDAKWMVERASEFLRRYGTKKDPVPAKGSRP